MTTLCRGIAYGVKVESRKQYLSEYRTIGAVLARIPHNIRRHIKEIFCDSKAGAYYYVILHPGADLAEAVDVGASTATLFMEIGGGYNGIEIGIGGTLFPETVLMTIGAEWKGDING